MDEGDAVDEALDAHPVRTHHGTFPVHFGDPGLVCLLTVPQAAITASMDANQTSAEAVRLRPAVRRPRRCLDGRGDVGLVRWRVGVVEMWPVRPSFGGTCRGGATSHVALTRSAEPISDGRRPSLAILLAGQSP
jgi:hypothetical protein